MFCVSLSNTRQRLTLLFLRPLRTGAMQIGIVLYAIIEDRWPTFQINVITKGSLSYLSSPCFSKNVLQSGVGIVH